MADGERGSFSGKQLLLSPANASILEVLSLLWSSNFEAKRHFIDFPEEEWRLKGFPHRWLIFLTLVLQKLFILLKKPVGFVSHVLEYWLNLVSSNGGFFHLVMNLLKGKVVWPSRSSGTFGSVLASLDTRWDLYTGWMMGSDEYNTMIAMMASKLSYENKLFIQRVVETHWKMDWLKYYNCWNVFMEKETTQAFVFENKRTRANTTVVAFRGTELLNTDDWCSDIDISWYELKGMGRIHGGFMKALGLQKTGWPKELDQQKLDKQRDFAYYSVRQLLRNKIQENPDVKILITGHSLGGSLAVLFIMVLALHQEEEILNRIEGLFTYGQPRVGDEEFGNWMVKVLEKYDVKYRRFVYCNDIVPRVPFDDETFSFKHFGPCFYYDSLYRGRVMEEEPNKNNSLIWFIPNLLNAVWELVRGFILPFLKGPDYKEGWPERVLRMIGLIIPGFSAHFPQDYVNLTRLGSESFFSRASVQVHHD